MHVKLQTYLQHVHLDSIVWRVLVQQIVKPHKQKHQIIQILLLPNINLVECVYLVNGAMIMQSHQVIVCKDIIVLIMHQINKYNAQLDFIAQLLALLEQVIVQNI